VNVIASPHDAQERTPLHILILTDRDWTHPQAGGTGTHLYGQVVHWLEWGHRVTVIAGSHPGAAAVERPAPNLELHHAGSRLTVFPRAAWLVKRGAVRNVDVVLEVVNGIAFFTPLWRLHVPRVALVYHVHRDMYVEELGRRGAMAAWLLETLPLRHLYAGTPFLTISRAAEAALVELGVTPEDISVVYSGVEASAFHPGPRDREPSLLYLGRIKRYKRLEILLDVLQGIPGTRLHVAGDGDHRQALEAEIAARGLSDRVTLHGFVSEERKRELYASAWVSLTASSAEGWCLTVMEAAACATPSAALRVGGLPESIVDGETGLLADDSEQLTDRVRELVTDHALREQMGAAAERRARTFTWKRTAAEGLAVLERARARRPVGVRSVLRRSLTRPAGVAAATLIANVVALVLTMVLARALGAAEYGALAALTSAFLILTVPGAALQLAVARAASAGELGAGDGLRRVVSRWERKLLALTLVVALVAIAARAPLAALAGVDSAWAAAVVPPAGVLWLALSVRRGALQGIGAHGPVATSLLLEGGARLVVAAALVAAGAGVTGALLGTPIGVLAAIAALAVATRRVTRPAPASAPHMRLPRLAAASAVAIAALTLMAVVQHVDVIVAQHRLDTAAASSYAAAAVAAKAVVWLAVGFALALLPELSRHARRGSEDAGRLGRTLVLVAAVATPYTLVCVFAGESLLRLVFGPELDGAADALPWLALAMALFACASVAVQHALALGRRTVVGVVVAAAVAEPLLLRSIGDAADELALALAAIQLALALAVVWLAARAAPRLEAGRA
jgi:glycosyltransferase involved in cell wall biosynthesis/O-antigen/teichoic acid export membrane protein